MRLQRSAHLLLLYSYQVGLPILLSVSSVVVLMTSEASKVSVFAIVVLLSSWPANTLVCFQCGSAGDK